MSNDLTELVERAKSGDKDAFDELVRQTYAETYTLALRLTSDEEDAHDVVQETYLRAFKGLKKFRGDAQFTTWLYRITANCSATHLGRRTRHRHDDLQSHDEIPDDCEQGSPEARADQVELRERLTAALRDLPPRLRAVVILRDIYDLPHEAIAEELGITESAAKVRLHRARHKLRNRLRPQRTDSDGDVVDQPDQSSAEHDGSAVATPKRPSIPGAVTEDTRAV